MCMPEDNPCLWAFVSLGSHIVMGLQCVFTKFGMIYCTMEVFYVYLKNTKKKLILCDIGKRVH